jgi:hypothetical protein
MGEKESIDREMLATSSGRGRRSTGGSVPMFGFKYGASLGTLAAVSISLVACAPPEGSEESFRSSVKKKSSTAKDNNTGDDKSVTTGGGEDEEDESENSAGPSSPGKSTSSEANATPPPGPAILSVTFAAAAKHNFAGMPIARVCSDRGAHHQEATFIDGTAFRLVSVDSPSKTIAKVDGAAFQQIKAQVMDTGQLDVPITASSDLPRQPQELAIIMEGDDRFGSPAGCGKASLKPASAAERDVEVFPNANVMAFNTKIGGHGCGIVGFVEVYFDQAQQKVIAKPSSQLLLAADDEGRAGFPKGNYYPACDGHDSPLVVDLGNRGITLSPPMANIFDVDGDGSLDDSPWVSSDDTPFLVHDVNGNGIVDGVDEMFGNRTRTASAVTPPLRPVFTSQNGFEALAVWDDAQDGVIDAKDKVWSSLRLWFDRNHDGRTDPGELETLEARGVRSIALSFVSVAESLSASGRVQGAVRQRGGATMTDGRVVSVVDVWFHRRF